MTSNLANQGRLSDLVRTVYQTAGYSVSIEVLPSKRAISYVLDGTYNGGVGVYYWQGREEQFAFSDCIFESQESVVTLKSLNVNISTLEDLKKYRIGMVRQGSGSVQNRYLNGKKFKLTELSGHQQSLLMLLNKRIDMVLAPGEVNDYIIKNSFSDDKELFEIIALPKYECIYTILSKELPNYQVIINDFNRVLSDLKRDGTVNKILKLNDDKKWPTK